MRREDVEALLARSDQPHGELFTCAVDPRHLAELCRRWLAVEDAPVTEVARVSVGDHGPHVIYTGLPQGQRVRIVPEQGEGDRG